METTAETQATLLERARGGDEHAFGELVQAHHGELRAHCYRMLGSIQDAEDAVQNALLRAWRGLARFEERSTVRAWLYSIATNTALDVASHRSRRELPVGFGPAGSAADLYADPVTGPVWLEPCPPSWLDGAAGAATPEARYEQRESVELAFMVMLQQLPPLQRAALVLRDVLGFSAAEVSDQLGLSVAAANSALQRARAAARAGLPAQSQQVALRALGAEGTARLARRYADALESGDADAVLSLLTADASWSMPPWPAWLHGPEVLRNWLITDPLTCRWRHVTTEANGQLAVGCYLPDGDTDRFVPAVIDVLTLAPAGDKITAVTAFVLLDEQDPAAVFASFGLPTELT
jgi:RNA polymerase sigma-70 factor (ECF subfamily)